jgi:7,8-dihydropterin-6-yl-methyl-4-(beta-D-ribofuranosyl)aminobenzene 5'-phosphate synthase
MKIITLIENKLGSKRCLYSEHGFSLYIEIEEKKILFDTGQSGNFIENAVKLGVDLKDLNYVIISHGHYDHSGDFKRLIEEINPNIVLYIGKGFFNKKYSLTENEEYKYRGNSFTEKFLEENKIPVIYIDKDIVSITENLLIFTNFNKNEEFENINQSIYLKEGGK